MAKCHPTVLPVWACEVANSTIQEIWNHPSLVCLLMKAFHNLQRKGGHFRVTKTCTKQTIVTVAFMFMTLTLYI